MEWRCRGVSGRDTKKATTVNRRWSNLAQRAETLLFQEGSFLAGSAYKS